MNGTLYVSKVAEEDEGKFICEADNGVNEPIGKLVSLKVNGEDDDRIDFEVLSDLISRNNAKVALIFCPFQPRRSLMWHMLGPSLAERERLWNLFARLLETITSSMS